MQALARIAVAMILLGFAHGEVEGKSQTAGRTATVDGKGVMRWRDTGDEVALFGVNYTVPFAYGYRALGYVGVDREQTIDQDVAHFARMGLDALRLHLWDREISDLEGNLLENDHLRLLDHLIARCRERGIYVVLTPIVWYPPAYPEPDAEHPGVGFSKLYASKEQMITDPDARETQKRYLAQLMEHVNPYTGSRYKDEPVILAFEPINEPWSQSASVEQVRDYIEALAAAIRETGCRKPLFYNASTGKSEYRSALREASVEGATYAWYPAGLVTGHSLRGNFLSHVDDYPDMRDPRLAGKAKLVYEFDAADVPGSHMYPAMARTFRTGGAQWATMFSYDPLPLAPSNTEYQTHYLNLVYTPNKAISLLIAGEAFRRQPRGESYGSYPENTRFGPFRVSYEEDLSEMVTETELLYSNDTKTEPPNPEWLERVVGCGSSPVVSYEGTGSYFLERLEAGIWRLEVYPDAVWVRDPYGQPCLDREVSRLLWRQWPMEIRLPDLGARFAIEPINEGNTYRAQTRDGTFPIRPGVYLLVREGASASKWSAENPFGQLKLGEFVAPAEEEKPTVVLHEPPRELLTGEPFAVTATVVSSRVPERVTLHLRSPGDEAFRRLEMGRERGYHWAVEVPADWVRPGDLEYCIAVAEDGHVRTYPADVEGEPGEEGFAWPAPQVLYAPERGDTSLTVQYQSPGGEAAPWRGETALTLRVRSTDPDLMSVQFGLVEAGGVTYVRDVPLTTALQDWRFSLRELQPLNGSTVRRGVRLPDVAGLHVALGEQSVGAPAGQDQGLDIASVSLEPLVRSWVVPVVRDDAPVVLFEAERDAARVEYGDRWWYDCRIVPGMSPGRLALLIGRPAHNVWLGDKEVVCRHVFGEDLEWRREHLDQYDTLRLTVRAREEATRQLLVALVEDGGKAWGNIIPLSPDWQEIRIPLSALRPIRPAAVPWGFPRSWPEGTEMPEYLPEEQSRLRVADVTEVQVLFGPPLCAQRTEEAHAIELESVVLEMSESGFIE